jgi:hypothetical protein
MGIRKIMGILPTLLLVLAIFANCAMAGSCLCGQACLHGLPIKAEVKSGSFIHVRCFGTFCKSCALEKGQAFKAANSATPIVTLKILDTTLIVSTFPDYHSINHVTKVFPSFCAYASIQIREETDAKGKYCFCNTYYERKSI